MKRNYQVYGLICNCENCEGVIKYVGQSVEGARSRFNKHKYSAKTGKPWPVSRWIAKHGTENISYEVLDTVQNTEELDASEKRWIEKLGTLIAEGGYNIVPGGSGVSGYSHPPDAISKRLGPRHSPETRKKISDAVKGRFGEDSARSELKLPQVEEIIKLYWEGNTNKETSEMTGVKLSTVVGVTTGASWVKVPRPGRPRTTIKTGHFSSGQRPATTKLTEEKVKEIRQLLREGAAQKDIAAKFGITGGNVSMINRRVTWKDVE